MNKILPHSIEIENALLFSILLNKTSDEFVLDMQKISFLKPEDFYSEKNQKLFKALLHFKEKKELPDPLRLFEYFKKTRGMNEALYVTELTSSQVIPSQNLVKHAQIIKKYSYQRQIDQLSAQIRIILQNSEDSEKITEKIKEIANKIADLTHKSENILKDDTIRSIDYTRAQKPTAVCYGLLPTGSVSLLAAPSGTGKTYTAISLAFSFIAETKGKALLWLSEDLDVVDYRVKQMIENTNWKDKEELILSNLKYVYDEAQPLLIKTYGAIMIDPYMASRLENYMQQFDFLVLDPLLSFFGSNENDNSSARLFLNALYKLVRGTKKSILLVHHTGKSRDDNEDDPYKILEVLKNQIRGASAFVDGVRTALYLKKSKDNENTREIVVVKSNVGKIGMKQAIQMPFEKNVHKIKV